MPASFTRLPVHERALARVNATVQGKYRIDRLLGIGGMASVYAATHRNGHRVAIKFLLDHLSEDSDIYRLFSREAYVANQVGHPGAVPVLDDDLDDDGCPFLIMPLLEGETMRARWERANKRLQVAEVGVLMLDVLDVLAAAHAKGIVHRDTKPDNLFVTTRGEVRVLDFGIARRTGSDGSTTVSGRMVGTPAFMPPEQALGDRNAIGPHSDCWAVGATLFTLLSSEFVHQADSGGAQLAAAATRHARSLGDVAPSLPAAIVQFVDKSLAFKPSERWHSAAEMRAALSLALHEALRERVSVAAIRVHAELVAELAPKFTDVHAEETRRPGREGQSDTARGKWPEPPHIEPTNPERGEGTPATPAKRDHVRTIMAAELTSTRPRRARRLWSLALGGVALLALAGLAVARAHTMRRPSEGANMTSWSKEGSRAGEGSTVHGVPPNDVPLNLDAEFGFHDARATPAEAVNAYNAGVQSWRDASPDLALEHFESATHFDPSFAAAHLRYALVSSWPNARTREHYQLAVQHRRDLSDADREVLEAYEPILRIPSNQRDAEHRLHLLVDKRPTDLLILNLLALTRARLGEQEGALEIIERAIEADRSLAHSWRLKGLALSLEDRRDEAELAYKACVDIAPLSTACLMRLSDLAANEGNCELSLRGCSARFSRISTRRGAEPYSG